MAKADGHNEQCTMDNVQWKKVKLGEVGEIISGGTPSTSNEAFWDGGVLFVTPLDLGRKKDISSTIRTISEIGVINSSANKIKKNSLAVSTRAPIGLMSIVNEDFTTNQGCKSIQFFENFDSQFFYYYLSYNVEHLRRYGQGTTFMEISKTDFANIEISVPSLPAQRRIAAILSTADKVIEQTRQLIGKYKSIKQGMMEDLLKPKDGWTKVKLGDLCTIHGRIGFRGYTTDDLVEKGYGAITFSPSDIHDYKLNYDNCDYISWNKYEESPEIKVFNGDILFCKTASIGKCAIVEDLKEKATINPQFVVLKDFACNPKYLYYKLISYDFQTQVQGITGGSTIKTMSQEKLGLEMISIPSSDSEQRRIAKVLSRIDRKIEAEEKVLEKYEKMKKGLMERLLRKE